MNTEKNIEFGRYIKRLREEACLSLREVEKAVGISNSYLYQIERGDRNPPKPLVLRGLAAAYGVTLDSLMAAAMLLEITDLDLYHDQLDRAFEFVRMDKRFKFGPQVNSAEVTPEVKRLVVEMYQTLSGSKLLTEP